MHVYSESGEEEEELEEEAQEEEEMEEEGEEEEEEEEEEGEEEDKETFSKKVSIYMYNNSSDFKQLIEVFVNVIIWDVHCRP